MSQWHAYWVRSLFYYILFIVIVTSNYLFCLQCPASWNDIVEVNLWCYCGGGCHLVAVHVTASNCLVFSPKKHFWYEEKCSKNKEILSLLICVLSQMVLWWKGNIWCGRPPWASVLWFMGKSKTAVWGLGLVVKPLVIAQSVSVATRSPQMTEYSGSGSRLVQRAHTLK